MHLSHVLHSWCIVDGWLQSFMYAVWHSHIVFKLWASLAPSRGTCTLEFGSYSFRHVAFLHHNKQTNNTQLTNFADISHTSKILLDTLQIIVLICIYKHRGDILYCLQVDDCEKAANFKSDGSCLSLFTPYQWNIDIQCGIECVGIPFGSIYDTQLPEYFILIFHRVCLKN